MKLDELEVGQRFRFADGATPCVYAGESPCGRWYAYWVYDPQWGHWSVNETADGEEEVICE